MALTFVRSNALFTGAWEPGGGGGGGGGGVGPHLESGIYIAKKFLKFFSYLFGPPLDKNHSQAPDYLVCTISTIQ